MDAPLSSATPGSPANGPRAKPAADQRSIAELQAAYMVPDAPLKPSLVKVPPAILRLMMVVAGFALWFGASTILQPRQSAASPPRRPGAGAVMPPTPTPQAGAPAALPAGAAVNPPATDKFGRKLLGSLVGSTWNVWIYSDASGPLYTVADSAGRVLAEGLAADDVYRQFPDLPVDRMRLAPADGALMLAEPHRE